MSVRLVYGALFDAVDALLRAHRPSSCHRCVKPLGLVAEWRVSLTADRRTWVEAHCPACVLLQPPPATGGEN